MSWKSSKPADISLILRDKSYFCLHTVFRAKEEALTSLNHRLGVTAYSSVKMFSLSAIALRSRQSSTAELMRGFFLRTKQSTDRICCQSEQKTDSFVKSWQKVTFSLKIDLIHTILNEIVNIQGGLDIIFLFYRFRDSAIPFLGCIVRDHIVPFWFACVGRSFIGCRF